MFFNSYSNINLKNKRNYKELYNKNFYYKTGAINNNSFSKPLENNIMTSKPKKNNYINYTFSEKNYKLIHKNKSFNFYHKLDNNKRNKKPKLTIVNDFFKCFQKSSNNWINPILFSKKSNINYRSSRNITKSNIMKESHFNNNYFEEVTNRDNISRINNNNISTKYFLNENIGETQSKIDSYDFMDIYKEKYIKLNEELKKINIFSKGNINTKFNKHLPIFKRLKVLKEAKNSIDKIRKNKINSSSSSKAFFEESNISRLINNYSERNKINYKDSYISSISSKKPIIIKYNPKPKLSVPKFININNIKDL